MRSITQTISTILLCGLPFSLVAEGVLPQDLEQISALQRRADQFTFEELSPNHYHLAKARAWLDLATSEYHQTDTSGALPAAINQAEILIVALEKNQTSISTDTPMDFPGSEKVRHDLWEKVTLIKKQGNYICGQRQLAESEVQLVWAGHEKLESGWSHAENYAKIAENSIAAAQAAIEACNGMTNVTSSPIATPSSPDAIPKPIAQTHVLEKITLSADALFDFDKATLTGYSKARLDRLTHDIKQVKSLIEVVLVGHSDRLRTDGKHKRNQTLSDKRAKRIKQYLVSKGVPVNKITAKGVGAKEPVVQCSNKPAKSKQIACLQPNRRVEITIRGEK